MSLPPRLAVNVHGDLRTRSPRALEAQRTIRALLTAGIEVEVVESEVDRLLPDVEVSPEVDALHRGRSAVVDLHLDDLQGFRRRTRAEVHPRGRISYAIGAWTWERPRPTWDLAFPLELVDEVWVGSTHTRDVLVRVTDKPVRVVPPVVEAPPEPAHGRERFGLWPASTVFGQVLPRGGSYELAHLPALLEAYGQAFAPHERGTSTTLALVVGDLSDKPALAEHLRELATGVRARLVEEDLDEAERLSFLAACDAYVSLHRQEATGRTIAEAMAAGTPVVATAHGPHLDWATGATSCQVGYELGAVSGRHHHHDKPLRRRHPVGTPWVEPDLDQAAAWMRHLHHHPGERARLAALGRETVREQLGPEAVGSLVRARLEELQPLLAVRAPA